MTRNISSTRLPSEERFSSPVPLVPSTWPTKHEHITKTNIRYLLYAKLVQMLCVFYVMRGINATKTLRVDTIIGLSYRRQNEQVLNE